MKLIVTGATGFVGAEIVRLALSNKAITSIIALARKPVEAPDNAGPDADTAKLHSIVIEDWMAEYPQSVKEQIKGADACIWNLAITPTKSMNMDFSEVTKVCHGYTLNGIRNMTGVVNEPFRFIYTSGIAVERDQSKNIHTQPLAEYRHMRVYGSLPRAIQSTDVLDQGRTENDLLEFAQHHETGIEVVSTRPGGIEGPGHPFKPEMGPIWKGLGLEDIHVWLHVSQLAAAMIELSVNGFTKDILWPKELVELGNRVISKEDYVS
ncbi:NAD(P)-binding protein [Lophiostoma macrostomum CBS 122681]|uniref:NAD(P)-binding protein n=1 Tax=Lophiostoma macrostomum CBS 122681 TaxID=1314788 RepID=A0A6A6SR97_9PLEO|nr:NAD(P)-binding protein [Lophiostoma macrostomum CBS 122681]